MFVRFHHHAGLMGGWGGWGFGLLALGVLLLIAIVVLIALVYRRQGARQANSGSSPMHWSPPDAGRRGPDAARILSERYARGEIDDEEYQRRLNLLRGPE
ncbi:putative membrane protein [Kitasatospora sp. MAP12-15]|uniref:SHOCT domain-containing protein n=1 Tax=unclassified Kitasatospora TaxID=2633591 RepID=UPI00247484F0|nr:SHOCT domain-containing protein [Kitasatospora sp. MAP12-44]MDH6108962.1 putative membrane protein [Kitasatospora sp. MAP12-44]